MNKSKISILTDPLPFKRNYIIQHSKNFFRFLRGNLFKNKLIRQKTIYRGHPAVTRSLINGFKKCKIEHNYNPKNINNLFDAVIVLAGVETLKQAIYLKKKGYIKNLFAGPNILNFGNEHNFLIGSSEVDLIIVPSEWVRSMMLEDLPSFNDKICVWPAGVDTDYWSPTKNIHKDRILIYDKGDESPSRLDLYINFLQKFSFKVDIVRYNKKKSYTPEKFKNKLESAKLMIGFTGGSESQGIAWAEAWSMDVPTLIESKSSNIIHGRHVMTSTAPYLNASTGDFFDNFRDFRTKFNSSLNNSEKFKPRDWVINNMSDEVIAQNLYNKISQC